MTLIQVEREQEVTQTCPQLPIQLTKIAKRKTARAAIKNNQIHIVVPKHWQLSYQKQVIDRFANELQTGFEQDWHFVTQNQDPKLSFTDPEILHAWVVALNVCTFNVPLKKVRIGRSKYTHLAQMNIRHGVMSISQYCLDQVPESALRYLAIHELAHLIEAKHNKTFWTLVKQFVPDYRVQQKAISAFHRIRLYQATEKSQVAVKPAPITLPPPSQSFLERTAQQLRLLFTEAL
jgi:predicted metal-dependent hydrolase